MSKIEKFRHHYNNCEQSVKTYDHLLENSDILDIGSNVGFFSEAIIKNVNYKSIHLFEPSKEYFNYSKNNVLLRNCSNIFFNNYGLGDTNSTSTLYKSPNNNIGWNTFYKKDPMHATDFIDTMNNESCTIKKLDDYKIENVDFIKIDVEGFEDKVIKGGLQLIKKFKPYILVEVGWGTSHPDWGGCLKIYNQLFDIGYEKVDFKSYTEDILFKPKDKK
tara:strand:+ start:44 stop:697 length:654 start_codon:yes stop_codon:yes gene_type:complete